VNGASFHDVNLIKRRGGDFNKKGFAAVKGKSESKLVIMKKNLRHYMKNS
jgi:hypothetical protein